jgi:predicted PurR-regulated permease PerM
MSYGPFEDRSEVLWWGLAVAFTATVLYVGYLFVGTFVAALFLYYGTRPFNRRIERMVGTPGRAALVTLLAVTIPLTVLVGVTTALGVGQLLAVEAAQVEGVVRLFFPGFDPSALPETPDELLAEARAAAGEGEDTGAVQRVLGVALGVVGAFATGLIHALLALVLVFYLLKEDAAVAAWFRGMVGEGSRADRYATAVDSDLTSVYYGTLLLIFVTAVIAAVFYYASNLAAPDPLRVPLPMLMALLTGVCMFVPVVITKLVYVPLTLYLGAVAYETDPDLLWVPAAFLGAAFVVLDLVPNALAPYLAGRSVHTGLMILTYIVGPLLFGWYGVFLGPLVMVVVLEFYRLVLPGLVRGEPVVGTAAAADGRRADAPAVAGPPVATDVDAADADGGDGSEPVDAANHRSHSDDEVAGDGARGDG